MYTIHQGINGGWYGSVTAPDVATAQAMATALDAALDALRATKPRRSVKPPAPIALTGKGAALIAWLDANPGAHARDMWEHAKPSKRTFEWLLANGFIAWDDAHERVHVLKRA